MSVRSDDELREQAREFAKTKRFSAELTAREWGRVLSALEMHANLDSDVFRVPETFALHAKLKAHLIDLFYRATEGRG